jgi:hypothetical protein
MSLWFVVGFVAVTNGPIVKVANHTFVRMFPVKLFDYFIHPKGRKQANKAMH